MDFSKKYKLGSETPLSVSQYIGFLNEVLKRIRARLIGEVSELQIAASGHVYFSLKDKEDGSVLRCVIWRSNYRMCGVQLKDGMEIIISGYSDIYSARGSLSFKAETIELVGEGALKKAYDELKEKLKKEGLFDEERKRPLPEYPCKIGVITSLRSGTVIHDFMSNLGKFGFRIKAMDSRVEGQEAIKDLLTCLKSFKNKNIEVLVIIRGGGSLQSLMAFDNELLTREIADFPVPVIAGIGHHKDVTLSAMAADASESTPTAAANLLNKPWESARHNLERSKRAVIEDYRYLLIESKNRLKNLTLGVVEIFNSIFENYREIERNFKKNLFKINYSIITKNRKIKEWSGAIIKSFKLGLKDKKKKIAEACRFIELNNPQRQLRLGYAIVKYKGKVLKKINQIEIGETASIEVSDGIIESEVKNKKLIKKYG